MQDLIKILYEVIANIPSNLMVTALVAYLIYDKRTSYKKEESHKKEHQVILAQIDEIKEAQLEDVCAHDKIYMLVLKLGIVNEKIPRYARLEMYDEYKALGGNSWVEAYADKNLKSPEPEHNRRKEDNKF